MKNGPHYEDIKDLSMIKSLMKNLEAMANSASEKIDKKIKEMEPSFINYMNKDEHKEAPTETKKPEGPTA